MNNFGILSMCLVDSEIYTEWNDFSFSYVSMQMHDPCNNRWYNS